jgi:hypothetical protein
MIHATTIPERASLYRSIVAPAWAREGVEYLLHFDPPSPTLQRLGIWGNAKRAWASLIESGASHACVLADDLIPCPRFENKLISFVNKNQCSACNFFQPADPYDTEGVRALMLADAPFTVPGHMTVWGGCLVLPTRSICATLQLADQLDAFGDMDDVRLTHALQHLDVPIVNVARSLVRHIGAHYESYSGTNCASKEFVEYRSGFTFDTEVI